MLSCMYTNNIISKLNMAALLQLVIMYMYSVYYCVFVMVGSTTGLPTTCQNMVTTTSSTGLMTEHGTLSAGLWVGR